MKKRSLVHITVRAMLHPSRLCMSNACSMKWPMQMLMNWLIITPGQDLNRCSKIQSTWIRWLIFSMEYKWKEQRTRSSKHQSWSNNEHCVVEWGMFKFHGIQWCCGPIQFFYSLYSSFRPTSFSRNSLHLIFSLIQDDIKSRKWKKYCQKQYVFWMKDLL